MSDCVEIQLDEASLALTVPATVIFNRACVLVIPKKMPVKMRYLRQQFFKPTVIFLVPQISASLFT